MEFRHHREFLFSGEKGERRGGASSQSSWRRPDRAKIMRWVLAVIACSGCLGYFPSVCSVIFLLLMLLLIPVEPLDRLLVQTMRFGRPVRTAAVVLLFVLAACLAPQVEDAASLSGGVAPVAVQQEQVDSVSPETSEEAVVLPPQDAEMPAEETVPSPGQEQIVYVTQTGKKYHRAGCNHLKKSQIPLSLSDAQAQGYIACGTCGG